MDEYEVLAGFDREKLNERILIEEDEIEYKKIRVSKTRLTEGIPHIRERHIDQIATFFANLRIPNWKAPNPLEAYRLDLNLPEMFRQYYQALREIKENIAQLEGKVDEKNSTHLPKNILHRRLGTCSKILQRRRCKCKKEF